MAPRGTPQRAAAFSGFDMLCPPLSFGKLLEGRGPGRLCGWERLYVLQHNKDPLDSLLAPNAQQKGNARMS